VSVCLACLEKNPKTAAEMEATIHRFTGTAAWQPRVIKVVAGALLYTKYNVFIRWIMKRIVAKAGGETDTSHDYEYTDWNDVRAFADQFALGVTGGLEHVA
jgi:menaquinone-dependent protoporphyrinogen oxidase